MNQRIAEFTSELPEVSRQRFTQRAAGHLDKIVERIVEQRAHETKENGPMGAHATARLPTSDQAQPASEAKVSIDPLAEIRRQQTEMLDRLAKARGGSKDRERRHEAGD